MEKLLSRLPRHVIALLSIAAGLQSGCSSATPAPGSEGDTPRAIAPSVTGPAASTAAAQGVASDIPPASTATAVVDPTHALITGTITGPDGLPVSDVAVTILEGTSLWPALATFSSAAGEYQWLVDPGTYTLQAEREGYASAQGEITAVAGEPAVLDITLARP